MKNAWLKIKSWLTLNHPEILTTLNPGATVEELKNLEATIGATLPTDFKEFWSIHNGQIYTHLRLLDGDFMLSTTEILRDWNHWKDVLPIINQNCIDEFGSPAVSSPDPEINDDWWNPLWIPITADGSGDCFCIDLDPAKDGVVGQIIRMIHDDPQRVLVATSFSKWISTFIADLEGNRYEASNDMGYGGIVEKY